MPSRWLVSVKYKILTFILLILGVLLLSGISVAEEKKVGTELEAVQVSGSTPNDLSPYDFIGNHDLIDLDIYKNQFFDLTSLLKKQNGIDIKSVSGVGQYSVPMIRGSESQQVLVFSNGLPINSLNGGSANIGSITLDNAQYIHIYRSFVPMELSPTAIGGAINIISNSNQHQDGSFKHTTGIYGVNSTHIQQSINADDLTINLDGLYQNAENNFIYKEQNPVNTPSNPKYEPRYNNATSTNNLNLQLNYEIDSKQSIKTRLSSQRNKRELPGLINTSLNNSFLQTNTNQINTSYKKNSLKFGFFDLTYQYKETNEIYDDRESKIGLGIQHNEYDSDYHSLNLTNSYILAGSTVTLNQQFRYEEFGIKYLNDSLSSNDDCYLRNKCDRSYNREQSSSGIRVESSITSSISLNNQLVSTYNKDDIPNSDDSNSKRYWSFFSGLNIKLNSSEEIYLTSSKQLRPPGTSELFGDRGTMIGNPNLKPELALGLEIGYRLNTSSTSSKISIYSRDVKNQIFKEQDSRGIISFDNYGKSRLSGIEISLDMDLTNNLGYQNNLTYQKSEILEYRTIEFIGNELSNHRTWFNSQSLTYSFENINLSISSDYQSGGFYNSRNTGKRPDLLNIDTQVNYEWQHSSVNLGLFNITNNQTRNYRLTPATGTTAYLTYRKQWSL
jgi:iron complex outermembrane receptor protein